MKDIFQSTLALLAIASEGDNKEIAKLFLKLETKDRLNHHSLGSISGEIDFSDCDPQEDIGLGNLFLYGKI